MSCSLPPQQSEECEIQMNKTLPAVFEGCQGVRTRARPSPAEMRCAKTFPKAIVKGRMLKCQRLTLPFSKNNTYY